MGTASATVDLDTLWNKNVSAAKNLKSGDRCNRMVLRCRSPYSQDI
jgi:hypothetical protein